MADEPDRTEPPPETQPWRPGRVSGSQAGLLALVIALAAFAVGYHIIEGHELEQSALLFIGLPTLLAMALSLAPPAKTTVGLVLKGTTLALLMSMLFLGEGAVCVVMAAPLIYAVIALFWALALVVGAIFGKSVRCAAALPLAVMALEGTTDSLSFPRSDGVAVQRTVAASPAEVEARLARPPRFDTALPDFLQLGFPRPQWVASEGVDRGDRWTVHFAGGEGEPGDLVLEVAERSPHRIRFTAVRDDSKIAHWLTWREVEVAWEPVADGATRVTWRLAYDRELDPAWYFGPLERHAARLAAGYLIDNLVARP